MGRLEGKNAIITGAAGGIGLETSIQFVKEGANVLMSDLKKDALEKALETVKGFAPSGVKVEAQVADVAKEADVKALVDTVDAWPNHLSVMFNNAGIMHPDDDGVLNTEEKIWDLTHSINVKGVFWGCKYAIDSMLKNNIKGSIINTGSFVGVVGAATPQIAYTASKGAVMSMTREMAVCYAQKGIRVNALCPGPLNTPLLQEVLDTDEKKTRRTVHLPAGRFGEAIEQAKATAFLASDDASYINGQDFMVDGGLTKAYVTGLDTPVAGPSNEVFGK